MKITNRFWWTAAILAALGACADSNEKGMVTATDTVTGQVEIASSSSEGAHIASITPGTQPISNRPTKEDVGRQTVSAPPTNSEALSIEDRSRLEMAPIRALGITVPTACDWTSVASSYQDRSNCRSGNPGSHNVVARITDLDPNVALEIEDADTFGWGPRLLDRTGTTLNVGDDLYVHTKSGTWTRCADVGPTDPCGSNNWNQITSGISARRWENGVIVEKWRRASSWVPPSGDNLSQQWKPVHQAAVSGDKILIPESHGRVSAVDRSTGEVAYTFASPAFAPTLNTAVSSGIAVAADGSAWYTVMDISPTNPFDMANSWLVHALPDGTTVTKTFQLLAQRDYICAVTFAFGNFLSPPRPDLTVKPWPPYIGAVGPTFPCRQHRPIVNATPAISHDGNTVYIVSRPYQNADHVQVNAIDTGSMARVWSRSLRDFLADGCGILDNVNNATSSDPTKCRTGSPQGIDKVTGLTPGGHGLDLAISSPVPTPDGGLLIGTYTPYDNERGHLFRLTDKGHPLWAVNFGWNLTPGVRKNHLVQLPHEFRVIFPDSHYDNAPFRMLGIDGFYGFSSTSWAHSQPGSQSCTRNGDIVDCVPAARLPGTGQLNRMVTTFNNPASYGFSVRDVPPGGNPFVYVPRSPVIQGTNEDVWTYSTDGYASLLNGETGALLERVFVDSAMVQSDVAMSSDDEGRLYIGANGGVTVVASEGVTSSIVLPPPPQPLPVPKFN